MFGAYLQLKNGIRELEVVKCQTQLQPSKSDQS
jgi:hypothetical protein